MISSAAYLYRSYKMAKNDAVTSDLDLNVPRETMELTAIERKKISDALDIYAGVIRRRVNTEKNEAVKAIYSQDVKNLMLLAGRFS